MSHSGHQEIIEQALGLPADQRAELAVRLCESLNTPLEISELWLEECRRRIDESESGVPGIPVKDVIEKLNQRRQARRAT